MDEREDRVIGDDLLFDEPSFQDMVERGWRGDGEGGGLKRDKMDDKRALHLPRDTQLSHNMPLRFCCDSISPIPRLALALSLAVVENELEAVTMLCEVPPRTTTRVAPRNVHAAN